MKLPEQATLGLQPNYAPGETVPTKLKQAVVLRMSVDALNALQANTSSFQVQFGSKPGLYIADNFYSMRPMKEDKRHELYLRAASQSKPNAPLKLFANITGECLVNRSPEPPAEPERVAATSAPRKKNKETVSMFRKPVRSNATPATSISNSNATKSSPATTTPAPPRPTNPPAKRHDGAKAITFDLLSRMIHCLALQPRPIENLTTMVGANKNEVLQHLNKIAVPCPSTNNQPGIPYKLLPESFKSVRPWEWPKLSLSDRVAMAKAARAAFKELRLPSSDPLWANVDDRSSTWAEPSQAAEPAPATSRRGLTTKEVREKKVKPKAETKELKIKDEGIRSASALPSSASEPTIRRPGSGFKMPKSSVAPSSESKSVPSTSTSSAPPAPTSGLQRIKKIKKEDVSDRDSLPPQPRPKVEETAAAPKRKLASRRNDDEESEPSVAAPAKRRRTDETPRPSSSTAQPRDHPLPKKPDIPARGKVPEPMRRVKQEKSPPAMSTTSSSASRRSKDRRREAHYTSSEDDEPPLISKRHPSISSVASSNLPTPPSDYGNGIIHTLPSKREELRALYDEEYLKYSQLNVKLLGQRNAIQRKLKQRASGYSDSEMDLMDVDAIASLTNDWQKSSDLLDRIRNRFEDAQSD